MKALAAIAVVTVLVGAAHAQQQAPPQGPAGPACQSQHVEAPGVSAAALIGRGYDIQAAVPGGLWLQKDREVYFCNSGRALDNDVLCWCLREPVKGQVAPQMQLIHKAGVE